MEGADDFTELCSVWQDSYFMFSILAIHNNETLPNFAEVGAKFYQNLNKPSKHGQSLKIF